MGTTSDLKTSSPTIRWTANEDVSFKCSLDDGPLFGCGDGKTGSWTGTNVVDGPHTFLIEGRDAIGNTGRRIFSWNKGAIHGFLLKYYCMASLYKHWTR